MNTHWMCWVDEHLNYSSVFETTITNQYINRIYDAIMTSNDSKLKSIQAEVYAESVRFRAAVWASLPPAIRDRLADVCPELL
jgi:hypothetical protein